jgi:hypothetical protein
MEATRKPFDSNNNGADVGVPPIVSVSKEKSENDGDADAGVNSSEITIDIRPLLEDVSQLMTKHISKMLEGVVGDYTVYKQTHDVIMSLPIIKNLQHKVFSLENELNSRGNGHGGEGGGSVRDPPVPHHQGSSPNNTSNDYDEVIHLKKLIDNLTKHITHLESQVCGKQTYKEENQTLHNQHVDDHDNCENGVRLEVHENESHSHSETDESDDESIAKLNHENKIVHTTNVMSDQTELTDEQDGDDDAPHDDESDESEVLDEEDVEAGEEEAVPEAGEEAEEEAEEEEEEAEEEEAAEEAVPEGEEEAAEEEEEEEAAEEAAEEDEEAVDEVEQEEEEAAADEDEIEVSEIKIKGKLYFTTNPQNGIIYACVNDDVGDEVGVFKNGIALFNAKK